MHVMFDLETWGTTPGSALRSIGAVEFDPMGKDIGRTFYRTSARNRVWISALRWILPLKRGGRSNPRKLRML